MLDFLIQICHPYRVHEIDLNVSDFFWQFQNQTILIKNWPNSIRKSLKLDNFNQNGQKWSNFWWILTYFWSSNQHLSHLCWFINQKFVEISQKEIENGQKRSKIGWFQLNFKKVVSSEFNVKIWLVVKSMSEFGWLGIWIINNSIRRP